MHVGPSWPNIIFFAYKLGHLGPKNFAMYSGSIPMTYYQLEPLNGVYIVTRHTLAKTKTYKK